MSGFSFGTNPNFGAPKTTAPTFNFGTPPTATTAQGTTGALPTLQGFGNPAPATSLPTLTGFGQAAPAASTVPTLGGFAQAAAKPLPTLPGFGAAQPAAAPTNPLPTLTGFGQLGAPTTGLPTLTGFGGAQPNLGNTAPTNFSFSQKPTTTASLNFGTATSTGGLFGKPAMAATSTTTAAPAPFLGLGGVDISASQPKAGDTKQDVKVKETQVPDEIAKTVDSLKGFIKCQKTLSSDIGRSSTSKLNNVTGEIMNLQWALQEISNSVETNYNHIKLLRKETYKAMQSAEMAQRTHDTPAGLQFENTAPFEYFQNLVTKYEQDLITFQHQISLTESHMRALTNPTNIAPEDLKRGFRQINESFISLAGRLHEIHQKVEEQKEQYLNLRKYRLHDATNVFAKLDSPEKKDDRSRITSGPTPFSHVSLMGSMGKTFLSGGNSNASQAQK